MPQASTRSTYNAADACPMLRRFAGENQVGTPANAVFALGEDGTPVDFYLYGDTVSARVFWDGSADTLNLGQDGKGVDVNLFGETASAKAMWDQSVDELTFSGNSMLNTRNRFDLFDDFIQQTLTEADETWILNSGSDPQAIDPAITAAANGVLLMTTGDDDGAVAVDAVQIIGHIPVQAAYGGLVFETRLHINTAITNVSVNAGLTDVTTLEEPFTIATATVTSNASDAACFVFDTGATTKQWFACAVDTNVDDTGNAATGTAPVADVYQVLRIEINATGTSLAFYINGTLVKTLAVAGITPNVALYPTVVVCGDGTASKTVDVDYIYVGHTRA